MTTIFSRSLAAIAAACLALGSITTIATVPLADTQPAAFLATPAELA